MKLIKEREFIKRKMQSGVSQNELMHSVGMFSNKNKEKVKAQKGLSEQQYKQRYSFLARVYDLLTSKKF